MAQTKLTMVNKRKPWILLVFLIFCHNPAYASGDPSVLYWLGSIAVVHIALFIVLYKKESSAKKRVGKLFAYSALVLILWSISVNWARLDFGLIYAALLFFPTILTIWLVKLR